MIAPTSQVPVLDLSGVGPPVVVVRGDLDLAAGAQLVASLDHHLAIGHRWVRLDLSAVGFADCAGVGLLIEMHNRFLAERGTLVLTGLHGAAARLVRMTGVEGILFLAQDPNVVTPAVSLAAGVTSTA